MRTFLEVSSLRDAQLTGIAETVCRLAECALREPDQERMRFIVGATEVHRDVIAKVVQARDGTVLTAYLASGFGSPLSIDPDDWNSGIFCHRVSLYRAFDRQAMVLYDLTPLICPQYHTPDTVREFEMTFYREAGSVDRIVTISNAVFRDLAAYFPDLGAKATSSLCGLPLGTLDHSDIALPPSLTDKPYFLSIGTLEPRKNNLLILETLSRHPNMLDTHRFIFVGKRGWGDEMEALIGDMGLHPALEAGDIVFTGFVDEGVKRQLIAGCVALVYPSHYEGFGLPLIEALALGRPVICQPTSSIPEVTGGFAYYIARSEPEALLEAIRRVLGKSDEIAALSLRYVKWARGFRWDDIWTVLKNSVAPEGAA